MWSRETINVLWRPRVEQIFKIGKKPWKGKIILTWHFWHIWIPKPHNISFPKLNTKSEQNYKLQSILITLYYLLYWYQGGRSGRPFGKGKNGLKNFRQVHFYILITMITLVLDPVPFICGEVPPSSHLRQMKPWQQEVLHKMKNVNMMTTTLNMIATTLTWWQKH